MWLGVICFGILAAMVWMNYRAAPETRSRAECLRTTVRLRNEIANIVGAVGVLAAIIGAGVHSLAVLYAGGGLVALMLLLGCSADRRERAAAALEQAHGD
jgi:hypothetical protein